MQIQDNCYRRIASGVLFSVLLSLPMTTSAQSTVFLGPELQVYPTGALPGAFLLYRVSDSHAVALRFGYNVVRHGDAGVHDDERGGGFGFSVGYHRDFNGQREKWFGEIRADLWFNEVDWQDLDGDVIVREGTSQVTVLQPTLKAGYQIPLTTNGLTLMPSIAFGLEINVKTNGGAIGQGAILLAGLALSFPL